MSEDSAAADYDTEHVLRCSCYSFQHTVLLSYHQRSTWDNEPALYVTMAVTPYRGLASRSSNLVRGVCTFLSSPIDVYDGTLHLHNHRDREDPDVWRWAREVMAHLPDDLQCACHDADVSMSLGEETKPFLLTAQRLVDDISVDVSLLPVVNPLSPWCVRIRCAMYALLGRTSWEEFEIRGQDIARFLALFSPPGRRERNRNMTPSVPGP